MHLKINMGKPFKGMIFAKGFSEECGSIAGKITWSFCLPVMLIIIAFLSRSFNTHATDTIMWNSKPIER